MSNPRNHVKYVLAVTLILTGLVAARPSAAQGTLLWQNLNGTLNAVDSAGSVAVDNLGNVVAAGFTTNTGTGSGFTVAKFDPHGTLLWQQNLNGTANARDEALSVAVDNLGNVVAAGFTTNTGTGSDFTVAKFDGNGTLLWQQKLNGTSGANSTDEARAVAVDNLGNVVAAGLTTNTGTGTDFTVAKFDGNGTLLWQQNLSGTGGPDRAVSVALDNLGNVVAAGLITNTGTGIDFTVAKFDPPAPSAGCRTSTALAAPLALTRQVPWRWITWGMWSPPAPPRTPAPVPTSQWRSSTATAPCSGSRSSTAPAAPIAMTRLGPWRWTTWGMWSPPVLLRTPAPAPTSPWRSSTPMAPCSGSRTLTAPSMPLTAQVPSRWTTWGMWSPPAPPRTPAPASTSPWRSSLREKRPGVRYPLRISPERWQHICARRRLRTMCSTPLSI